MNRTMAEKQPKQRVLVIGCGYVGAALAYSLVRSGHDVTGTTTTHKRMASLEDRGVRAALLELPHVDRLCELAVDRDVVFLTLAPKHKGIDYRAVYVEAAKCLNQALRDTAVRHVLYTSSTRVYGQSEGRWVDEDSPTEATDANRQALIEAERVLLEGTQSPYSTERVVTVLRLGGLVGGARAAGLKRLCRRDPTVRIRAMSGSTREDGEHYLNLVHRDHVTSALVRLMAKPYQGVLNLTDDGPVLRRIYYDEILSRLDQPPIRWLAPATSKNLGRRVRNDRIKQWLDIELNRVAT